jgi:hypothetical protein
VRSVNARRKTQLFVMHLGDLSEESQIIPLPDAVEQTIGGDRSDQRKKAADKDAAATGASVRDA